MEGALAANIKLSDLSKTQMDWLIDLFLQLNRDDLPVVEKIEGLKYTAFDADENTPDGKQAINSLIYYRQMSRDLESLRSYLVEEGKKARALQDDLKAIRGGR
jgi:hypothetical protein